ncbi:hypothetical protein MCOR27_007831 [Pyricularia oryzae]|nr:hypothetical protein MCOR27_007831 [Pyricularia oryzae]KAI6280119.1 hypothetical protein MCOR26_003923 [Pyricularia oryzae]KAI6342138.1 hypothetical protein MCOR28_005535 [Pyricularia oryzae]KAI6391930.1 hypothetical protein MCOR23_008702 [Pyricularia oryzae]KAI6403700.1 hypothetical protein MCOR20_007226 [Pyricularia oryzae]
MQELWRMVPRFMSCLPTDIISLDNDFTYAGSQAMLRGENTMQPNVVWDKPFCDALQDVVLCPNWERSPSLLAIALRYLICCKTYDIRKWPELRNPTTDRFLALFLAEAASNTTGRTVAELHTKVRRKPEIKDAEFNPWSRFFTVVEEHMLCRRGPNSSGNRKRDVPAWDPFKPYEVHTEDLKDLACCAGFSYGRTWVEPSARSHLTKRARRSHDPPIGASALRDCLEVVGLDVLRKYTLAARQGRVDLGLPDDEARQQDTSTDAAGMQDEAPNHDHIDEGDTADTEELANEIADSEEDGNLDDLDDDDVLDPDINPDERADEARNTRFEGRSEHEGGDNGKQVSRQPSAKIRPRIMSSDSDDGYSDGESSGWNGCSGNDTSDDMPSGNTPLLPRGPRLVIEIRPAPRVDDLPQASLPSEAVPTGLVGDADPMPCFADSDSDLDEDTLANLLHVTRTQQSVEPVEEQLELPDNRAADEFESISDSQFAAIAEIIESVATSTPSRDHRDANPTSQGGSADEEDSLSLPEIPASLRLEAEAMHSATSPSQRLLPPVFLRHGKRRGSLGNGKLSKRRRGPAEKIEDDRGGSQGTERRIPYSQ